MSLEWPQNIEVQKGNIDISNLSYDFCDDELINTYYEQKSLEIADRDKWLEENQENLLQSKDRIAKAVQDGLIANDNPETIWQFQSDRAKKGKEKIVEIKKELERKIEQIKIDVTKRLSEFLPNWKSENATVTFTMNDKADFCVDRNEITVDLGRLLGNEDFVEKVTEGITHEVFHIWMKEKNKWSDSNQDNESDEALKYQIVFRTIDEGLAVLVSGQSLSEHHEQEGRDYQKYITESFEFFREFLAQNNRAELEKMNEQEFKNMGHFYVVGNEIAKTVLRQIGVEKFRKLIEDCRLNPGKILDEYESVCNNNPELISIRKEK
ncbi:MAG: DUF5700 domain-containing putative Zn-dependent protease [Candidatus Moraniibacteriota bacterium]